MNIDTVIHSMVWNAGFSSMNIRGKMLAEIVISIRISYARLTLMPFWFSSIIS